MLNGRAKKKGLMWRVFVASKPFRIHITHITMIVYYYCTRTQCPMIIIIVVHCFFCHTFVLLIVQFNYQILAVVQRRQQRLRRDVDSEKKAIFRMPIALRAILDKYSAKIGWYDVRTDIRLWQV